LLNNLVQNLNRINRLPTSCSLARAIVIYCKVCYERDSLLRFPTAKDEHATTVGRVELARAD